MTSILVQYVNYDTFETVAPKSEIKASAPEGWAVWHREFAYTRALHAAPDGFRPRLAEWGMFEEDEPPVRGKLIAGREIADE